MTDKIILPSGNIINLSAVSYCAPGKEKNGNPIADIIVDGIQFRLYGKDAQALCAALRASARQLP